MRVVDDTTVDAMVSAFLVAEATSPRFGEQVRRAIASIGAELELVTHPDISDPVANGLRRRVLSTCRGFPDRGVFTGVPPDTLWQRVLISPSDLDSIRYINWDWWLEVTGGSRKPADALHYYRDNPSCRAIVHAIVAGHMPPPIILVARPGPTGLVVLEGHLRLTAMLLARAHLPSELPAVLGTSPTMDR
jgi:hypothetical protein